MCVALVCVRVRACVGGIDQSLEGILHFSPPKTFALGRKLSRGPASFDNFFFQINLAPVLLFFFSFIVSH